MKEGPMLKKVIFRTHVIFLVFAFKCSHNSLCFADIAEWQLSIQYPKKTVEYKINEIGKQGIKVEGTNWECIVGKETTENVPFPVKGEKMTKINRDIFCVERKKDLAVNLFGIMIKE